MSFKQKSLRRMILAAMFLALALVLPFFTGQIPQIGNALCPMHIPVLLCGFFCGPWYALAVGGIREEDLPEYRKAGVCGFGIGSRLVDKSLVDAGDYAGITALAEKYTEGLCHG